MDKYTFFKIKNNILILTFGRYRRAQIVKSDAFFESCKQRVEILLDALKGLKL